MYTKINYSLVGFFVLIFIIGILSFTLWLGQHGIKQDFKTYKLLMKESVSGLSKDSVVRLRGVNIGKVKEIKISSVDISITDVLLYINSDVIIKKDMVAFTEMLGITGLKSIEISGGTNESENLISIDGKIPVIRTSSSLFKSTTKNISHLFQKVDGIVDKLDVVLSSGNIKEFSNLIIEYKELAIEGKKLKSELSETLVDINDSLFSFNSNISLGINKFSLIQKDFEKLTKHSIPAIDNFNLMSLSINKSILKGDYNFNKILEPMLVDISILTNQFSNTAEQLNNSPSDIFFKSRKKRGGPGE